jgi:DNA invertase Pin-like site-specific DNA recombinase
MNNKISEIHLERSAYVYIRQSTQFQVDHNKESQRRQYALVSRAKELGWNVVEVIDEDLGCSGSGTVLRKGFERLVALVGMGKAGAVFSLEASRLARNNRDWHHLIDICAMVGTLIIDQDGVYDTRVLNDRLLLGLKGTMSEFELSLLRQRAHEGLRLKASRGELYTTVPIGYIRSRDNRCEKDPDERVTSSIAMVYDKFNEMRSARQVLLWFRQEKIQLPTIHYGMHGREIIWKPPVYNTIIKFLSNPIYAGVYVFGRTATETYIENGRARKRSGMRLSQDKWNTVIKDHHESYISWETYEKNQVQLNCNANMKGLMKVNGAVRSGRSLLAGLLRCSRCGRRLRVSYTGKDGTVVRYNCRGAMINNGDKPCISFGGLRVDAAIEQSILDTITPVSIEAAVRSVDQKNNNIEEKRKALELELKQAEYEAQRAFRQYNSVDPENRLVADELERRWNDAIKYINECKLSLEKQTVCYQPQIQFSVDELGRLADALPDIWKNEKTDMRTKKMIVRTLIREIIADIDKNPEIIQLTIHWNGGDHTTLCVKKNRTGHHSHVTEKETVQLIEELSQVMPDSAIAATLNRLGHVTGYGHSWTQNRVASLRNYQKISHYDAKNQVGVTTMEKAAEILQISPMSVRRLIENKILQSTQVVPYAPQLIKLECLKDPKIIDVADKIRKKTRAPLPADPNQEYMVFN